MDSSTQTTLETRKDFVGTTRNAYAYVGGDPGNKTDSFGLVSVSVTKHVDIKDDQLKEGTLGRTSYKGLKLAGLTMECRTTSKPDACVCEAMTASFDANFLIQYDSKQINKGWYMLSNLTLIKESNYRESMGDYNWVDDDNVIAHEQHHVLQLMTAIEGAISQALNNNISNRSVECPCKCVEVSTGKYEVQMDENERRECLKKLGVMILTSALGPAKKAADSIISQAQYSNNREAVNNRIERDARIVQQNRWHRKP